MWSLSVLPNGNLACDSFGQIHILNTDTTTLKLTTNNATNGKTAAFQNDYIASGDFTGVIKIWDANNGSLYRIMESFNHSLTGFWRVEVGIKASRFRIY